MIKSRFFKKDSPEKHRFEGCEQNLTPEKGLEVGTEYTADFLKPESMNEDTIEQSSSRTSERSAPMFISLLNVLIISDVDQEIDRKAQIDSKRFIDNPDCTKDLKDNNTAMQEHSLYIASDDVGSSTSLAPTVSRQ